MDFKVRWPFSHHLPMIFPMIFPIFSSLGDGTPVAQELRWRRALAKAFRELRRSEHVKAALEVAAPGVMATWRGWWLVGW